eukprot:jgi/Mesvir1/24936/Mv16913-RA.1
MQNQVGFDQAIATLSGMFAGMDKEVIAVVLEAHNGRMEDAVETLLGMTPEADGATGRPALQDSPPRGNAGAPPYAPQSYPPQAYPPPPYPPQAAAPPVDLLSAQTRPAGQPPPTVDLLGSPDTLEDFFSMGATPAAQPAVAHAQPPPASFPPYVYNSSAQAAAAPPPAYPSYSYPPPPQQAPAAPMSRSSPTPTPPPAHSLEEDERLARQLQTEYEREAAAAMARETAPRPSSGGFARESYPPQRTTSMGSRPPPPAAAGSSDTLQTVQKTLTKGMESMKLGVKSMAKKISDTVAGGPKYAQLSENDANASLMSYAEVPDDAPGRSRGNDYSSRLEDGDDDDGHLRREGGAGSAYGSSSSTGRTGAYNPPTYKPPPYNPPAPV